MKISNNCVSLVKQFEGFEAKAYKCPAGVWTIGYGHTLNVRLNDVITEAQASTLLEEELQDYAAKVSKIVPSANQNQFDAMVVHNRKELMFNKLRKPIFQDRLYLKIFSERKKRQNLLFLMLIKQLRQV
jgi:hypothetical protein